MDPKLTELKKQLRSERCPSSVLERVTRQIKDESQVRRARSIRWAVGGVSALATIVLTFTLWKSPKPVVTAQKSEHQIVREQALLSLVYFGKTFQRAGAQSRDIILEVSLPPLRQGLRKTEAAISPSE